MIIPNCIYFVNMNNAEVHYSIYEYELLGIVWALGQYYHYFQGPYTLIECIDHSPLRHLPSHNLVKTRIWQLVWIMHGYNLEIQYIPRKVNPADHFSHQSLNQSIELKSLVSAKNIKYV